MLRTSDPDIYAAGDVAEATNLVTGKPGWFPLAQVSNKMGREIINVVKVIENY